MSREQNRFISIDAMRKHFSEDPRNISRDIFEESVLQEFLDVDPDNRKSLMYSYRSSDLFRGVYDEAYQRFLQNCSAKDHVRIQNHLFGRVFEDLSIIRLQRQNPDEIVVSHHALMDFYKSLFPELLEVKYFFDLDSLYGLYLPDALVFEKTEGGYAIAKFAEFKAGGSKESLERSYLGYENMRERMSHTFHVPDTAQLHIGVLANKESVLSFRNQGVEVDVDYPFTYGQYKRYFSSLLHHYAPHDDSENYASLSDIRKRVTEQSQWMSDMERRYPQSISFVAGHDLPEN